VRNGAVFQKQIHEQKATFRQREEEFAKLMPTVERPCIDSLLKDVAALRGECEANLHVLGDLHTEVEQRNLHAPPPPGISILHNRWSHLVTKVLSCSSTTSQLE